MASCDKYCGLFKLGTFPGTPGRPDGGGIATPFSSLNEQIALFYPTQTHILNILPIPFLSTLPVSTLGYGLSMHKSYILSYIRYHLETILILPHIILFSKNTKFLYLVTSGLVKLNTFPGTPGRPDGGGIATPFSGLAGPALALEGRW